MDQAYSLTLMLAAGAVALLGARRALRPALSRAAAGRAPLAHLPLGWYASVRAPTTSAAPRTGAGAFAGIDPVARRKLLRWFGWTTLLVVLAELLAAFLPFFWPRKTGAFGGTVLAGSVNDYKVGDVKKITEGKFYISRVPEGFLALWQKCPHLGCAVPWLENQRSEDTEPPLRDMPGRFNCPCHGSIYDRYGQIITGPAPRPMDLFPITIRDGRIYVETGPAKAIQRTVANHQKDPVPA